MAFGDILNDPAVDHLNVNFGTSWPITLASTPAAGSLLLVCVTGGSGAGGLVTPSGFSVAQNVVDASLGRQNSVYAKISDGTETAVAIGQSESANILATVYVVEGPFDSATPDESATSDNSDSSLVTFGSITTSEANAFVLGFGAHNNNGVYSSVNSGFVADVDDTVLTGGNGFGAVSISKVLSSAGTESPAITLSSAQQSASILIAFYRQGVADTTAPTFSAGPTAGSATEAGHTISTTLDEAGTIYAVRLADGASAPSSAQVKAGQDSTGSAAPEAKSVSASAGVSADMVFSTGSGTTAYDYYVVAEDDEGAPNLQTSPTLVEATTTAPVFSVDSVSGGDQPGESWVFALSNDSGADMTANIGGTALTVTAQTSGSITVTIPDPLTFDGGIYRFSENLTVQIVDGANSDTIATPITPATGFAQVQMPNPIAGVWASSTFEAAISPGVLEVGDYIHCTAPTDSDPENGVFPEDSTIVYRIMEMSDPTPVWGAAGTITIPAAADITPDQFDLGADVTGAEPSAVTTRTFTIAGIDSGETISFTATGDASVSPSTGQLGDTITVTLTAGPFGTTVTGGVTSGGVSDSFSVTSRAAVTPTIDTQPTNQTVNEGATATFTAAFTNAASIQWYDASDDSALSGETSASLSITTVLADNGNTYYAIATSADSQTAQTNTVTLTVNEVVVVTPPAMPAATTATVAEGSTAVGTYTASSGDSPITYTLGGTDAASFTINGATGVVAFASAPDYETKSSYSFTVIATNSAGSDSQAVTVTVTNVVEQAPTINTGGSTSVTITEGNSYSDPAWTWGDDVVSGQSVTWSGDTVNSSTTEGEYTRTATATNAFGTTTQDYTITVVAAPVVDVDYIPRLLSTDVQEVTMFAGRGNRFKVTVSHDGTALDLSAFTRFELSGLTTELIDSSVSPSVFDISDGSGVIYIDSGSITEGDLITTSGTAKTILIGYTATETEGVVLWHPQLAQAHVTVNIIDA